MAEFQKKNLKITLITNMQTDRVFDEKEELEKIQTMAEVINLAEENDFEELYLSYMDF